jgi:hypothetical protein
VGRVWGVLSLGTSAKTLASIPIVLCNPQQAGTTVVSLLVLSSHHPNYVSSQLGFLIILKIL